jgi:hypothetical protein
MSYGPSHRPHQAALALGALGHGRGESTHDNRGTLDQDIRWAFARGAALRSSGERSPAPRGPIVAIGTTHYRWPLLLCRLRVDDEVVSAAWGRAAAAPEQCRYGIVGCRGTRRTVTLLRVGQRARQQRRIQGTSRPSRAQSSIDAGWSGRPIASALGPQLQGVAVTATAMATGPMRTRRAIRIPKTRHR